MPTTPLEAFYHWESSTPDSPFLRQPINGQWHVYSYKTAGQGIRRIAAGIKSLQLPPQSNIAILSKNCAHWIMADLAIWMAGHVSVPIYPTFSASSIRYILEHSETKAIFVGKLDDFSSQRSALSGSIHTISFPFYGPNEGILWDDLLKNSPLTENYQPVPESLATVMYSSGTTGTPKGVMLSFKAFDFLGKSMTKNFKITKPEKFFSYLPLSHIAERAYIEISVLYSGSNISFAESLEKFPANLHEVQPTLFGGVPRIFAKFQEGVLKKMPQPKLDRLIGIPIVGALVKKAIRKKLGLGKVKLIIGGAAPIPVPLLSWYKKIGLYIQEVYGMTENGGYSHGDHGSRLRFGTVGKTWDGIESRISEEGEILVKHPGLMMGYYKDPETTASVFTPDGFLKTGDKGMMNKEGYLTITGRIKDQFKTDKAKFISPGPIETQLLINKDIEQVCVVGMGIPQPIALITLSLLGKEKSKESIAKSIEATIDEINPRLEHFEQLEKAVILRESWTIENGLMTPSLKVKRNEVEKIHLSNYPVWYKTSEFVIWE
ncbi:MAG TPA: AMP-binding protein [Ohtaekwangia sp.]